MREIELQSHYSEFCYRRKLKLVNTSTEPHYFCVILSCSLSYVYLLPFTFVGFFTILFEW